MSAGCPVTLGPAADTASPSPGSLDSSRLSCARMVHPGSSPRWGGVTVGDKEPCISDASQRLKTANTEKALLVPPALGRQPAARRMRFSPGPEALEEACFLLEPGAGACRNAWGRGHEYLSYGRLRGVTEHIEGPNGAMGGGTRGAVGAYRGAESCQTSGV